MKHPKLRDSGKLLTAEPWPLGQVPTDTVVKIGGGIVHLLCIGRKDLDGKDWGDIFADAMAAHTFRAPWASPT